MEQKEQSFYWKINILHAWKTLVIIFFLQNAFLYLSTGNLSLFRKIGIINHETQTNAVQIILIVSIIKLFILTLSGFILAFNLSSHQLRNALVMGGIIGLSWGVIGLIQIVIAMVNTPPQLIDTSIKAQWDLLLFIPKQVFVCTLTTSIGSLFASFKPQPAREES